MESMQSSQCTALGRTIEILKTDVDVLHYESKMGLHFGELGARVRGVVSYSLSPLEQKAFAGAISHGVPNMFRRFRSQVFRVAPPFVLAYLIYDWGEKEHARLERKNPADYENES